MTTENDPTCVTCGNTKTWHEENNPKHPLNLGDVPVSVTFGRRSNRDTQDGEKRSQRGSKSPSTPFPSGVGGPWPFDPVLRQALIDRGVLTPQDLRDAEAKIQQVTSIFEGGTGEGKVSQA